MKTVLSTKGFEDYLEKLATAGADIDEITDEALTAGGQVLLNGMQRRAPKLTRHLVGRIRLTEPSRDGNYHSIKVGIFDVNRPKEVYFFYQEFGSPRNAAQPYLRPTLDGDMAKARAEMRRKFVERGAL